jgi:hypothetical protein
MLATKSMVMTVDENGQPTLSPVENYFGKEKPADDFTPPAVLPPVENAVQEAQQAIRKGQDQGIILSRLRQMYAGDPEKLSAVNRYFQSQ